MNDANVIREWIVNFPDEPGDVDRETAGAGKRSNGIARFAGTWTEAEYQEFLSAIAVFEVIDFGDEGGFDSMPSRDEGPSAG